MEQIQRAFVLQKVSDARYAGFTLLRPVRNEPSKKWHSLYEESPRVLNVLKEMSLGLRDSKYPGLVTGWV